MSEQPPRPPSDRKREAGHINGLKSAGTKTPEGLAASSQNARTLGLFALRPILSVEEVPHFDALYADWALSLRPQNPIERQTLQDIVEVHWELRRLRDVERANIEMTICLRRDTVDQQWDTISPHGRVADAMSHLANTSKFPAQLNRQLARLSREQDRLIKLFHQLRRDCPPIVDPPPDQPQTPTDDPHEVKNEGNPISEQPEADTLTVLQWSAEPSCSLRNPPPPAPSRYMAAGAPI
ncbi:MAG: hypothetical protein SGI92_00315 [Bryobacteraceae bacterium]|nr:hypothetical protein [Bryobacteraceae bacterium]